MKKPNRRRPAPSGPLGTLAARAAEAMKQQRFKEAVDLFKLMIRHDPQAEWKQLLAEASDALASSLDYETTLARVARLAIPRLADWCVVDMRADDGSIRRLAVTHVPAIGRLARGSVFLLFAFLGVESALVPSGEVRDPARTVPRAIGIALGVVVAIYICVQLVTQSALGPALAGSRTPVADSAAVLLGSLGSAPCAPSVTPALHVPL